MKIAFFHELPRGGAKRFISEVAKLLKKKHRVHLFVVDDFEDTNALNHFNNVYQYFFSPKV